MALMATVANASVQYDQNVTNNAIWGSGNSNGGYTTFRDETTGIELGLRAKVRFPTPSDNAAGIKSQGNGTYGSFDAGTFSGGNASWNIDWSINSNYNSSGGNLNAYTYTLQLDIDPSAGTNFVNAYILNDPINGDGGSFDIIGLGLAGHTFGTNATGAGGGTVGTVGNYNSLLGSNNLVQNSLRPSGSGLDPNADGLYTIRLTAYNNGNAVGTSEILVQVGNAVVPEAASLLTWGGIISCVGLVRRRRIG
jgi:hypothetical protein